MTKQPLAWCAKSTASSLVTEDITHPQPKLSGNSHNHAWMFGPQLLPITQDQPLLLSRQTLLQTFFSKLSDNVHPEVIGRAALEQRNC